MNEIEWILLSLAILLGIVFIGWRYVLWCMKNNWGDKL